MRGERQAGDFSPAPAAGGGQGTFPTFFWDLCHYGFPDGCDPFSEECLRRFTDYCRAVARTIVPRPPPRFFAPINAITFFSGAARDMGWIYPFAKGRYDELKRRLCRMAIAGVQAIREVDPDARMVHTDPLINEVPPEDRPNLADRARERTCREAFEAWDMLYGSLHPELASAHHYPRDQLLAGSARRVAGDRGERVAESAQLRHRPAGRVPLSLDRHPRLADR